MSELKREPYLGRLSLGGAAIINTFDLDDKERELFVFWTL